MTRLTSLPFFLSLALPAFALSGPPPGALSHQGQPENATYDYVVVGGGTAGLAIAARLAEDSSVSVAVVEAGGYYESEVGPLAEVPGFGGTDNTGVDSSDASVIDWNFETQPLTAVDNRVMRYARGKTLGGCSARNFMVYQRGNKGCYDQWAEMTGDDSWSWDAVFPYFKESVHLTPANMSARAPNTSVVYDPAGFEADGGPLSVTWPNYGSTFSTWMEVGLEAVGVPAHTDFNTGTLNGTSWPPATINAQNQTRETSQTSYLNQALLHTGLTVYPKTMALKVDFDGTTATGVQVRSSNYTQFTLQARREVILSAGTFQSPQLLMVSGVGPRDILEEHAIPVVRESPGVGQNMWDHFFFGIVYQVNLITNTNLVHDLNASKEALEEYKNERQGPLTSPGFGLLGFGDLPESEFSQSTRHALSAFPSDWPSVEYLSIDGYLDGWHSAADQLAGNSSQEWASIGLALVSPLSRGNISISSPSAEAVPLINMGYLTHPGDQEVAIAGFKRLRETWAHINVTIGDEHLPGSSIQTDDEIIEFIRSTLVPVYHAAGTCAMGRTDDTNAVVDSNARVIGVENLRVVDASIFPTLPPGHPQSTVYMVAEKIADLIRNGQ
ncbi:hypothetical protein BDV18DRAFT_165935 [Aspergillus unguis]